MSDRKSFSVADHIKDHDHNCKTEAISKNWADAKERVLKVFPEGRLAYGYLHVDEFGRWFAIEPQRPIRGDMLENDITRIRLILQEYGYRCRPDYRDGGCPKYFVDKNEEGV